MAETIIVIMFFLMVWFFTGSFFGTLIITAILVATLDLTFDIKIVTKAIDERIVQEHHPNEQKEPALVVTSGQMFADQLDLPDGRITDKLRNQEVLDLWAVNGTLEARRENGERFTPDVLMHEGTAYACQRDSINCYIVR